MPHDQSIAQSAVTEKGPWLSEPHLARVPALAHGFGTRALGDQSSAAANRGWLQSVAARELRLLRQVHGVRVVPPDAVPDANDGNTSVPTADAWAGSSAPGVLLGILTADCLPVIFCHPASRRIAIAHAGWRGAVGGIAGATLSSLGVPAAEVLVALGPCIGPCCYQVGGEVAAAAGSGPHIEPWADHGDRFRLDLPRLVRNQLRAAGIRDANINTCVLCTVCHPELFFSHRRDGDPRRMVSVVGWRSEQLPEAADRR